jgi:monoamine oxidase
VHDLLPLNPIYITTPFLYVFGEKIENIPKLWPRSQELEMTSTGSPVSPVRTFNPEGWPTPYSHSAIAEIPANARIIQISGQVAVDIEGKTPDTFDAQVKLVFENLRECLRTAGGTVKDIVKLNFYVVDHSPEKLVAFGAGLMPFLGDARPASTFIGVVKLAMPEWMVEVECTAAIPDNKVTEKTTEEVDVVVVGAGLSGLEAALNLEKARLSVLVLEAKDRAGGKTCSVSNGAKGVVELGAAWFNNTNQSEMWALSQQYGFDTVHQLAEGLDCVQASDGSVTTRPYGTGTVSRNSFVSL